jgi:hypothetical protein
LFDGAVAAERIITFDPFNIPKAGKSIYGKDKYRSGVAGTSKWWLEIGGFAVADTKNNSAFHLQAYLNPCVLRLTPIDALRKFGNPKRIEVKKIADYIVVDAYFSKAPFMGACLWHAFD